MANSMKEIGKMKFLKTIASIITLILIIDIIVFVPKLIKYNGKIMESCGEYNGYNYAYSAIYGLWRKGDADKKYQKISDISPSDSSNVFYHQGEIFYSSRGDNVVRINLSTMEQTYYEDIENSVSLYGVTDKYLITTENKTGFIKIFSYEPYKLVENIKMIPRDLIINNSYIVFEDYDSGSDFKFEFDTGQITSVNESSLNN
jgi:hypothetical protein